MNHIRFILITLLCTFAGTAWAVNKTVTYTFTAERVGSSNAYKLTFTPSGEQFGTSSGLKTVTISDITSTKGFWVELDDGVRLQFSKDAGQMTFSGNSIMLNFPSANNPRFTVSCSDYYIRHVTLADKDGKALYGTSLSPSYTGQLDVDVDIDKYGGDGTYTQYIVSSIPLSTTFGSITVTLADHTLTTPEDIDGLTYNGDEGYYEIADADDLRALAAYVNADTDNRCIGLTFKQTADITFSYETACNDDTSVEHNFDGIGYTGINIDSYHSSYINFGFSGTYDGAGHTISGIRIYKINDSEVGLFGNIDNYADATVKNVHLTDTRITAWHNIGGIVGNNKGNVTGCTVGNDVTIQVYGSNGGQASNVGGIVGWNDGGTVTGCTSSAVLTTNDTEYATDFGGIVGSNDGSVTDCHAYGVFLPNVEIAGAIVGKNGLTATIGDNTYHSCICGNYAFNIGVGRNYTSSTDYTSGDHAGASFDNSKLWLFDDRDNSALITVYSKTYNSNESTAYGATHPTVSSLSVTLKGRTLYKDGSWNTLCLPFDAGISGYNDVLKQATVMELDRTTTNASGHVTGFDSESGTLTLNFKTATSIEKRKPYIIKWNSGDDIFEPTFRSIDGSRLGSISGYNTGAVTSQDGYVTFRGTYDPFTITTENRNSILYVGSNNKIGYRKTVPYDLGAFRAYFELKVGAEARSVVMNFEEDGEATANLSPTLSQGEGAWYTITGVRLNGAPTAKGVYINDGKRVMIK